MDGSEKKVFNNKAEILEAFGWSEARFQRLVRAGLPVVLDGRSYTAHRDQVDEFYQAWLSKRRQAPD